MNPYYDEGGITIYHGDCRDVLPELDGTFNVLVTDPPYSSGGAQEGGRGNGSIGTRAAEVIQFDNLSTRGYRLLMREVFRWCNQAEELYLFTDWRMWIEAFDAVEGAGWRVRNMVVWDKQHFGLGSPWRNQHELIVYGKRSASSSTVGGARGNVIRSKRSGNRVHPTEKPTALLSALIENTPSDSVVCDPFMGSGSTLHAAQGLKRRAIGIEIEEKYCEIAVQRLAQGVLDFGVGSGTQ